MPAAAQIGESAGFVKSDFQLLLGKFFNQFKLKRIILESFFGAGGGNFNFFKSFPGFYNLFHFGFYFGKVLFGNLQIGKIIIKAVLDGRTQSGFGFRPKGSYRRSQKMRGGMSEIVQIVHCN